MYRRSVEAAWHEIAVREKKVKVELVPRRRGNRLLFLLCGLLDFESAVTAQNDELKGSFDSSYSRSLNVKTKSRKLNTWPRHFQILPLNAFVAT